MTLMPDRPSARAKKVVRATFCGDIAYGIDPQNEFGLQAVAKPRG